MSKWKQCDFKNSFLYFEIPFLIRINSGWENVIWKQSSQLVKKKNLFF